VYGQVTMTNQAQPNTNSAALATTTEIPAILAEVLSESRGGLSRAAQYELVKTQIAPGCDDGELALFLSIAKSRGLDVFARQIYARKQRTWDADKREHVMKMILITSIDGFRLKAQRTGEHTGTDDAEYFYDERRVGPLNPAGLVKCRVIVHRKSQPFAATTFWDEMRQTYTKNNVEFLNSTWAKMPHAMLAKTCESLALRKAFPEELNNIHVDEEVTYEAAPAVSQATINHAAAAIANEKIVHERQVEKAKQEFTGEIPAVNWDKRASEAEGILRACANQDDLAESFTRLSVLLPKGKAPQELRQRIGNLYNELETKLPKTGREPGVD
jgi:phage recombination protein Bet